MHLRMYQGLVDITTHCNLTGNRPPRRVYQRVLFTPDEGVHLCSAERMIALHHLDYVCEWEPNIEIEDEVREQWENGLRESDTQAVDYVRWHDVVDQYHLNAEVTLRTGLIVEHAYQGAYQDDEDEDAFDSAREDAQGNVLV